MRTDARLCVVLFLLAGCGGSEADFPESPAFSTPGQDLPPAFDELAHAIDGVACGSGAFACSNEGDVWTAATRVGHSGARFGDVAQTFTALSTGTPTGVSLKLRLLRPLTGGENPAITVSIRLFDGTTISTDPLDDLVRGTVSPAGLSKDAPSDVTVSFTPTGAPVTLQQGEQYALVLRAAAPLVGDVHVGVSSMKAANGYSGGQAYWRGGAAGAEKSFVLLGGAQDLSFSLAGTASDGGSSGTVLFSQTAGASQQLDLRASSGNQQAFAERFVLSQNRTILRVAFFPVKQGSPAGNIVYRIVRHDAGTNKPSLLAEDLLWTSEPIAVSSVGATAPAAGVEASLSLPLTSGTYYVMVEGDATYKASYTTTDRLLFLYADAGGSTSRHLSSTGWFNLDPWWINHIIRGE